MKPFIVGAAVVLGLAFLLLWRSPVITKGAYRMGFFLGLAAFAGILFGPGGGWYLRIGSNPWGFAAWVPITLLAMAPFLLLLESGIAGYRGFSSWMRYVSLVVAVLGAVGLVASFVLPHLLREAGPSAK